MNNLRERERESALSESSHFPFSLLILPFLFLSPYSFLGRVLSYIGSIRSPPNSAPVVSLGVTSLDSSHPFAGLSGSDNIISFTTGTSFFFLFFLSGLCSLVFGFPFSSFYYFFIFLLLFWFLLGYPFSGFCSISFGFYLSLSFFF